MTSKLCKECKLIEVKPGKEFCGNPCRLKAQKRDNNPLKLAKKNNYYFGEKG